MVLHRNAASGAVYSGSARQRPTFALVIPPEKADRARDALIAHGFPEETMQQDDGFSVYVRDPDGNKIELYGKRTEV
jgi:catechol 2,3-dioxygenase-like lactoylglutathione lyase family enzyme